MLPQPQLLDHQQAQTHHQVDSMLKRRVDLDHQQQTHQLVLLVDLEGTTTIMPLVHHPRVPTMNNSNQQQHPLLNVYPVNLVNINNSKEE